LETIELAVASRQRTISQLLFAREFSIRNNTPTTLFFSVSPNEKINVKGCHFDTTEMIKAESQDVLKTIDEAFKNGRSAGDGAYERKVTTSRVMVVNMPKVAF
jgi:hypothetical protein